MVRTRKTAVQKQAKKAANAVNLSFMQTQLVDPLEGVSTMKQKTSEKPESEQIIKPHPNSSTKSLSATKKSSMEPMDLSNSALAADLDHNEEIAKISLAHTEQAIESQCPGELSFESSDSLQHETGPNSSVNLHCECNEKIEDLKKKNLQLQEDNEKLKMENSQLSSMNFKLQEKVVQDNNRFLAFTAVEGYPSAEWLLRTSQAANQSDYLFVKELVMVLWPNGVGHATVSGRASNNPNGNKKRALEIPIETSDAPSGEASSTPTTAHVTPSKLEPEKVEYIRSM